MNLPTETQPRPAIICATVEDGHNYAQQAGLTDPRIIHVRLAAHHLVGHVGPVYMTYAVLDSRHFNTFHQLAKNAIKNVPHRELSRFPGGYLK